MLQALYELGKAHSDYVIQHGGLVGLGTQYVKDNLVGIATGLGGYTLGALSDYYRDNPTLRKINQLLPTIGSAASIGGYSKIAQGAYNAYNFSRFARDPERWRRWHRHGSRFVRNWKRSAAFRRQRERYLTWFNKGRDYLSRRDWWSRRFRSRRFRNGSTTYTTHRMGRGRQSRRGRMGSTRRGRSSSYQRQRRNERRRWTQRARQFGEGFRRWERDRNVWDFGPMRGRWVQPNL